MHRNAPLTPEGRHRLCQRIEAGWPVAHAAESMHISRDRAYVWWRRYQSEGVAGLEDRSSRPHRSPARTKATKERRIVGLRRKRGLGPARIAGIVGVPARPEPRRADDRRPPGIRDGRPRPCIGCWFATGSTVSTISIGPPASPSGAWR
jgi:leucine-zipper of insertion element IS481